MPLFWLLAMLSVGVSATAHARPFAHCLASLRGRLVPFETRYQRLVEKGYEAEIARGVARDRPDLYLRIWNGDHGDPIVVYRGLGSGLAQYAREVGLRTRPEPRKGVGDPDSIWATRNPGTAVRYAAINAVAGEAVVLVFQIPRFMYRNFELSFGSYEMSEIPDELPANAQISSVFLRNNESLFVLRVGLLNLERPLDEMRNAEALPPETVLREFIATWVGLPQVSSIPGTPLGLWPSLR
jgi:hypothetical protein